MLNKITKNVAALIPKLNAKTQGKSGDKTLRVDKLEVVARKHNGASDKK